MEHHLKKRLSVAALAMVGTLVLSSCGGTAGSGGDSEASAGGFEYGAPQEEVETLIADLEPVTLTFQPNAASQNSPLAGDVAPFIEAVEQRSGGKIEFDIVWGQAIAGYGEIDDALVDGRLDMAYTINGYNPSEYPALAQFGGLSSNFPKSPMASDLIVNGAMQEVAWSSPEYVGGFEDKGLTLLLPAGLGGGYYSFCNSPGNSADDWQGRQVRSASQAQDKLIQDLNGVPVSIEFTETYEALQRGTIDCSILATVAAVQEGTIDVAPHMSYSDNHAFPRGQGEYVAGSSFNDLPLAYQQIIFDAMATTHAGQIKSFLDPVVEAVQMIRDNDGTIEAYEDDLDELFGASTDELVQESQDSGLLNVSGSEESLESLTEKWEGIVEELGYEDGGELQNFDEWYDPETVDFLPFTQRVFEESALEHRPS